MCVMPKHTSKEAAAAACLRPLSSSCTCTWAADLLAASACCTASCSRLSASCFALQRTQLHVRHPGSVALPVMATSACCTAFCSQSFASLWLCNKEIQPPSERNQPGC